MALIVPPRMSPANVNTLPRQLAGWLADAQRRPTPDPLRRHRLQPTDRQRVKGQLSDAHCRQLNAGNGANTSYLMGTWQANYERELGASGGIGSPAAAAAAAALSRLNFHPDRILMRKDKRARQDAFFLSGLCRPLQLPPARRK